MLLFARHYLPFFCQKVLPTVYDNSLSYYEFLCKMYYELCKYIDQNDKNVESLALKIESMESPDGISDVVMRGTVADDGRVTITSVTKNYEDVYLKVRDGEAVLLKFLYTYESDSIMEAREHLALMRVEGNPETGATLVFNGLDTFNLPHSQAEGYDKLTMCRLDWRDDRATFFTTEHHLPTAEDIDTKIAEALVTYATQAYADQKADEAVRRYNVLERTNTNTSMFDIEVGSHLYKSGHVVAGSIGYAVKGTPERGTLIANNLPVPAGTTYTFIGHKLSNVEAERDHVIVARLFAGAPEAYPDAGNGALLWWYGNAQAGDVIFFDVAYVSSGNLG